LQPLALRPLSSSVIECELSLPLDLQITLLCPFPADLPLAVTAELHAATADLAAQEQRRAQLSEELAAVHKSAFSLSALRISGGALVAGFGLI
jgi:hypothetical protein